MAADDLATKGLSQDISNNDIDLIKLGKLGPCILRIK